MTHPLLPPRGILLPTSLLFDRSISSSARDTWTQLRALAWGRNETPPFSLEYFAHLTGKKASTVYGHMAALRDRDALRWRPADRGTIVVSFPEPSFEPVDGKGGISMNLEKPSLKDSSENLRDVGLEVKRGATFQISGNPGAKLDNESKSPVEVYRSITRVTPNFTQRARIAAAVFDLDRWQATLEHWLAHGWFPRNLPGMLDLYSRGGPSACRFCRKSPDGSYEPLNQSLSALEEVHKELFDGSL